MAGSANPKTRQLYEFGPFRLDPEKDLLLREDETIPIAPKAFQILLVLIRHNKQVVTKDDLMKTIWPDTFVEEANLSRNIFLLRKALGESPQDHQYTLRQGLAVQLEQSPFLRLISDERIQQTLRLMDKPAGARLTPEIARDPRDWGSRNQLSVTYIDMGQLEEGLKEGQESARLEPHIEPPWRRQLDALMCLNRLPEAEAVAAKARALGIDGSRIHQRFLELAHLQADHPSIAREIQWFSGKPEEYLSFGVQAAYLNMHGQRRESSKEYQRAAETARRQGLRYVADDFEEADARADALAGNCQKARGLGRPALALAMCGETAEAEKLVAETSKQFPNGTIWNAVQLPELEAMIEPAKGIERLASASPYERVYPDAVYVRGLVYLQLKRGAEAAAEFLKIADHEGASWGATWVHPYWGQYYALSYLGMARAYVLAGDGTQAKDAYEKFFALWKTADPDLPVLRQARAEYTKLR